ncbi:hypothetical protein BCR44DRAFT_1250043 [Catenaria anguillulae PL171]|uniref:Uncharacterized protein n=1 Tax=Catenaria anguillulae PL171 TaxID=765915 RepID=A0A1Y2I026_9FUNG|nr:hypothetical protein BCR44DRAFT_1250043 [Catenaria anguillulae PL171]
MRHQVVWNYVSVRVAQALGNGQERFDMGLAILKSAQKDNSIPTDRWSPLVPFIFSTVPTPSSMPSFSYPDGFSLVQDQLTLWSVVTVDPQRYPQVVDRTVTAFLQANAPHQLKQAVSAAIELVSHDPNLPSQTFLPLLKSRANWLQHQVPLPPRPQAPAASSSSSWVIPNASYPSDARIDQFLKTNEHTLHITGFSGIADARKWARNHPPPSNALRSRLVVEAGGIGKRAYVEVRKVQGTRVAQSSHVHQASADDPQMREYRQELERIQQVVQCIEAGQPVPNLAQGA